MQLLQVLKRLLIASIFFSAVYFVKGQVPSNQPVATTQVVATAVLIPTAYNSGIKVNYVRTREAMGRYPNYTAEQFNAITDYKEVKEATQYIDGLGRQLQVVSRQITPGSNPKDMVAPVVYDAFGREVYNYLPYVSTTTDGKLKMNPFGEQAGFMQAQYPGEQIYYAKTIFEASPLSRIQKAFAPGNSWAGTEGSLSTAEHAVKMEYLVNTSADAIRIWSIEDNPLMYTNDDVTTNIPTSTTSYQAGKLLKSVTKDEHGNVVVEYKDKDGLVIIKKVQIGTIANPGDYSGYTGFLCTYYIYDDLNRLRFVIPPKAIEAIKSSWQLNATIVNELCFRYEYDERSRMIAKKVPGAGWVYMIYDKRDRLVLVQDANMRSRNQWMKTLYDELNRPIMTGMSTYVGTPGGLQGIVSGSAVNNPPIVTIIDQPDPPELYINKRETGILEYKAREAVVFTGEFSSGTTDEFIATIDVTVGSTTTVTAPSSTVIPNENFIPLTITHYDDYSWTNKSFDPNFNGGLIPGTNLHAEATPAQAISIAKGLVTGTEIRIIANPDNLAAGAWVKTVSFYDDRNRVIQINATNHKGGNEVIANRYDFTGKIISNISRHNNPAAGSGRYITFRTRMEYDHNGRLLRVFKKDLSVVPGNILYFIPEKLISNHEYNELGQLKTKRIGVANDELSGVVPDYNTSNALEVLDYSYNIRGWLKGINSDYANKTGTNANNRWFGMELNYDWGFANNQFNGNISGTKWRSKGDGEQRAFGYGYDAANRLLYADFNQKFESNWAKNDANTPNYSIDFSVQMGNGTDAATAYDENGNIKKMKQWGLKLNSSSVIDDLNYTYTVNSNKLQNVIDASNDAQTVLGDFRSSQKYMTALNNAKAISAIDYTYDANGNLKKDLNKDIGDAATEGIEYNHLNLPYKITVKNTNGVKGTISYIYDAAGNKLEKRVQENTNTQQPEKKTVYIGPFVYENDKLQLFSFEEGRIRVKEIQLLGEFIPCDPPANAPPDYQCPQRKVYTVYEFTYDYFLKDHLGNTRMVLTEEKQKDIYPIASLESTSAIALENTYYKIDALNIMDRSAALNIPQYPNNNIIPTNNSTIDAAANSQKLYRLHGNGTKMGLGITLKVIAGDVVDIMGKSYWKTAGAGVTGVPDDISVLNLLKDFVGPGISGKLGINGDQLFALTDIVTGVGSLLGGQPGQTPQKPKAYINWILFDENFRPVISSAGNPHTNSGFDQVDAEGILKSHLRSTGEITKNGYLYIYCSNESKLDVFFDNLQVIHTRGALLEETHYYPFGLTMAGISSKAMSFGSPENKYKYNGIEFENDLDLNTYDAQLRELDPQLGRWWELDPKVENMEAWSPYVSNYDNPIKYSDPLGDEGCCDIVGAILEVGKDVLTFTAAAANAFVTNQVGGVGRGDPSAYSNSRDAAIAQAGQTVGDVATLVGAVITSIGAAVGEIASVGTASPIAITLAIQQVTVAAPTAFGNLSRDLSKDRVNSNDNSSGSGSSGQKKNNSGNTSNSSQSKVEKSEKTESIGDGKFTKTTEVRPGKGPGQSRTEYIRYKNKDGQTIRSYKDSYDRANKFQHRKPTEGDPEGRRPKRNN